MESIPVTVPTQTRSTGLIIFSVLLFLIVVALAVWIGYLYYRRPPSQVVVPQLSIISSSPVYLFGYNKSPAGCNFPDSAGALTQVLSALSLQPFTNNTTNASQWNVVPGSVAGSVNLQNVSSQSYITTAGSSNNGNIPLTVSPNKANAVDLQLIYNGDKSNTFSFSSTINSVKYYLNVTWGGTGVQLTHLVDPPQATGTWTSIISGGRVQQTNTHCA